MKQNIIESLPSDSEGNRSHRMSRHSGMQTIISLHTYTSFPRFMPARINENQRNMAPYAFCGYHHGFRRNFEGREVEPIAAGWPPWMVEDAGEALRGCVPTKEKSFHKLEKVYSLTFFRIYFLIL